MPGRAPVGPWALGGRGHQLFPILFVLARTIYVGQELGSTENDQWENDSENSVSGETGLCFYVVVWSELQLVSSRRGFNGNVNNSIDF